MKELKVKLDDLISIIGRSVEDERQNGWTNGILLFKDSTRRENAIDVYNESASSDADNHYLCTLDEIVL